MNVADGLSILFAACALLISYKSYMHAKAANARTFDLETSEALSRLREKINEVGVLLTESRLQWIRWDSLNRETGNKLGALPESLKSHESVAVFANAVDEERLLIRDGEASDLATEQSLHEAWSTNTYSAELEGIVQKLAMNLRTGVEIRRQDCDRLQGRLETLSKMLAASDA